MGTDAADTAVADMQGAQIHFPAGRVAADMPAVHAVTPVEHAA
jgi:hypothetical protein